jgi:anti-anti-sigma regulatory factor
VANRSGDAEKFLFVFTNVSPSSGYTATNRRKTFSYTPKSSCSLAKGCAVSQEGEIDRAYIHLPAYLDLTAAEGLHAEILQKSAGGGPVVLDAGAVEVLTSPCVQVLVSADNTLSGDGRDLRVRELTDAFRSALVDLGLQPFIEKWEIP